MKEAYRPSHADFTYDAKYGRRMAEGGGRSSARETIGRVAAGAVARRILKLAANIEIIAWVETIDSKTSRKPKRPIPPRILRHRAVFAR